MNRRPPDALTRRHHPLFSPVALFSAVGFIGVLGVVLWFTGGRAFSPGALSAQARTSQQSGGFEHHAAFADDCTQCHTPFQVVSAATCEACHVALAEKRSSGVGLHGALLTDDCTLCHQEHLGADADLYQVALDAMTADTHASVYPLLAGHVEVACTECHLEPVYATVATACEACHQEPDAHLGLLGTDCANCHTAERWEEAEMREHVFAIDHGQLGDLGCQLCHAETYTVAFCSDCHTDVDMADAHGALGLDSAELAACATCHVSGTAAELTRLRN